jgi:hypothetical protein
MSARMVWVLLAAALLVAGIHEAALRGLADAHYTSARLTLAEGTAPNGSLRAGSLAAAIASLRQALVLEPSNPLYVEQFARLEELRALQMRRGDPAASEALHLSLARYHDAVLMRPGSPYVWASVAMLKARLDQLDFEFYRALERAGRLGPWEPQVQIAMIDVGLATWPVLARTGKNAVLGALERALLRQATEVKRIAAAHGTLTLVCSEAGQQLPRIAALCVKN